ncbi:MAG: hypothetical protein ACLSUL_09185 [[Ruminococcus] torques]
MHQNEGFKTAGQVQYVGKWKFVERGAPYHGSYRVVRAMLSYDSFEQVRVKGGAYGVMCFKLRWIFRILPRSETG